MSALHRRVAQGLPKGVTTSPKGVSVPRRGVSVFLNPGQRSRKLDPCCWKVCPGGRRVSTPWASGWRFLAFATARHRRRQFSPDVSPQLLHGTGFGWVRRVPAALRYQRHRPEETPLYRIVSEHLESFLAFIAEHHSRRLPRYVENEFRNSVECGTLPHGFSRARCTGCGHEIVVAFSCKLRGICPSCNARRMCDTAAHLVDHVLPDVRLRQWVLSVPFEMRILLAANPKALSAVGRIFCQEISRWQKAQAQLLGFKKARGGAICFPQRFGGSLNLNVHYHVVAPDAAFAKNGDGVEVISLAAPTHEDLDDVAMNRRGACWRRWRPEKSEARPCRTPSPGTSVSRCAPPRRRP